MGKLETKIRVLAYTENYAHKTVTFITNELKYLSQNHELHLAYSTRINPELYELEKMYHIPFQFNVITNKLRWWLEQFEVSYWCLNFRFKKELNRLIEQVKPMLIHCHFGTDFLKLITNLDKKNRQIPIVISFYGFDVTEKVSNKAYLNKYIKYLRNKNIFSLAVSGSLVDTINQKIKPVNSARLLHSGIDTDFFVRKEVIKNSQEYRFIQVSSYLEKKGHSFMLEAFKKFIESDNRYKYKLILIGFGPLEQNVRNKVKELNLEQFVEMLPPVSPQEMVDACSAADCFVQLSIKAQNGDCEGLPNAILEAMSLEMPILSTFHAGIPEIVENGVNGILCEEKNINNYVNGFREIVSWKRCPHNRQKIVTSFSFKKHCLELENTYRKILSENREVAE